MILATASFTYFLLAAIWFVLMVTLGVRTLRGGHWIMFVVGIFIPIFWIIGALVPPKGPQPLTR